MSLLDARWTMRQVTTGTGQRRFHQHSYYDIPVFDQHSRRVAVHEMTFAERDIAADDRTVVGIVDLETDDGFQALGETVAFSLQQGPMAQWVPGRPVLVWSDREQGQVIAMLHDLSNGTTRTLPAMIYALSPDGTTGLSLNMDRLDALRPGYGYAGGADPLADRVSREDGVWRVDLETGECRLILSLAEACDVLKGHIGWRERGRFALRRPYFWLNHAKIAPDGKRFTVKLRWRQLGRPWSDRQGVSLTAALDGSDVRLLARGTSHVIWEDGERLFFHSAFHGEGVVRAFDAPGGGCVEEPIGPGIITTNVHMRAIPGQPGIYVYDTPYREDVGVLLFDDSTGRSEQIASFNGHKPPRGRFRCDVHPNPSPDGRRIVVSSLQDGGRQVYVLDAS